MTPGKSARVCAQSLAEMVTHPCGDHARSCLTTATAVVIQVSNVLDVLTGFGYNASGLDSKPTFLQYKSSTFFGVPDFLTCTARVISIMAPCHTARSTRSHRTVSESLCVTVFGRRRLPVLESGAQELVMSQTEVSATNRLKWCQRRERC